MSIYAKRILVLLSLVSATASATENKNIQTSINNAFKSVEQRNIEQEAAQIKSMSQVRSILKGLTSEINRCGVGSCVNAVQLALCDYIAVVDIRLNGQVLKTMVDDTKPLAFKVSSDELYLLQLMANSCKMTNYQYWNFTTFTHVGYFPSADVEREVNKSLSDH